MPGRLVLCGTPIGNLGDASPRLKEALEGADTVYAEDTRRSRVLLDHFGIRRPLRSYFAGNEAERAVELRQALEQGATVALVTDAGMPAVSDPGVSAVRAARDAGADVTVVPGPSAVTAAVAVSGLPSERFVFEGFLPRRGRAARLRTLAAEERTIVMFLSPHRAGAELADLASALGPDRAVCVARELTKLHEEIWWGTLAEAEARFGQEAKGEFTIVVEGQAPGTIDLDRLVDEALRRVDQGEPVSDVVKEIAAATGVSRNQLYEAVLRRRTQD